VKGDLRKNIPSLSCFSDAVLSGRKLNKTLFFQAQKKITGSVFLQFAVWLKSLPILAQHPGDMYLRPLLK